MDSSDGSRDEQLERLYDMLDVTSGMLCTLSRCIQIMADDILSNPLAEKTQEYADYMVGEQEEHHRESEEHYGQGNAR